MLQRTQRFAIACPWLPVVPADLCTCVGSLRRAITRLAPRRRRRLAFAHVALGLCFLAQLSKCLRDQTLNIIARSQLSEARNRLRVGKVPLILCNLDEIADRWIAGPSLPQGGTGQSRGHAFLQKGADVAAGNDRFYWRQAAHIKGARRRFCVCGVFLIRARFGNAGSCLSCAFATV